MNLDNVVVTSEMRQKLDKILSRIVADPKSKWNNKKRYSKLNESLIRGYILSHLRDVRVGGRAEADKMMNKLISGKKVELSGETIKLLTKNRNALTDFACSLVSRLDSEALTGFFVPFIYGGLFSCRNVSGEIAGIVNFESGGRKITSDDGDFAALNAVERLKRRGIGIIVVIGRPSDIYSMKMLSLYQRSRSECFIIIEKGAGEGNSSGERRESLYGREVLSGLCRSKNVFLVLDGSTTDVILRSRALSSYGILHGAFVDGRDQKMITELKRGSAIAIFDRNISLDSLISDDLTGMGLKCDVVGALPTSLLAFLSSPSLPFVLPNLFDALSAMQYIKSNGGVSRLVVEKI